MSEQARPHYGRTAQADKPHFVYRHYDAAGQLLYVGCTSAPKKRPYATTDRPWITESVKVIVDGPYEWCEALELEAISIAEGKPLHNKRQKNGSWARREIVRLEDQMRAQGLDPAEVRARDRLIKTAYRELYRRLQDELRALQLENARPRPRKKVVADLAARADATRRELEDLPDTSYLP